jgi:hypothetical protein
VEISAWPAIRATRYQAVDKCLGQRTLLSSLTREITFVNSASKMQCFATKAHEMSSICFYWNDTSMKHVQSASITFSWSISFEMSLLPALQDAPRRVVVLLAAANDDDAVLVHSMLLQQRSSLACMSIAE